LLLDSFAQGPASDPRAHLVLVGEGQLQAELDEQARKLNLAGKVHFLGLRNDIPDVLGAMDVFVLSSDYEGNPLSVLEAMASGLPIVSTAAGGVPNLFETGKEGFLVAVGDLHGLAKSMTAAPMDSRAVGPRGVRSLTWRVHADSPTATRNPFFPGFEEICTPPAAVLTMGRPDAIASEQTAGSLRSLNLEQTHPLRPRRQECRCAGQGNELCQPS